MLYTCRPHLFKRKKRGGYINNNSRTACVNGVGPVFLLMQMVTEDGNKNH